eukprot:GHVU01055865.1.p1 GENE.GHVU01055865.1~~GHVU01055865.1.p1  ORF type:complete len:225 (-),score=37.30 GHVU01055865.1:412-1086(-)
MRPRRLQHDESVVVQLAPLVRNGTLNTDPEQLELFVDRVLNELEKKTVALVDDQKASKSLERVVRIISHTSTATTGTAGNAKDGTRSAQDRSWALIRFERILRALRIQGSKRGSGAQRTATARKTENHDDDDDGDGGGDSDDEGGEDDHGYGDRAVAFWDLSARQYASHVLQTVIGKLPSLLAPMPDPAAVKDKGVNETEETEEGKVAAAAIEEHVCQICRDLR